MPIVARSVIRLALPLVFIAITCIEAMASRPKAKSAMAMMISINVKPS
jgi:hypothetical protein